MDTSFKIVLPAELEKGADGDWRIRGLASTASRDRQGEIILQDGIDLSPIDEGRGILNFDHGKGPENTIGLLDGYQRTDRGLVVEGRLFKNHSKAKAVYEIMSSLGKADKGRMGMSVEGKILERAGADGKVIKKCQINAVALTMNPVNQDSQAELIKSLTASQTEIEWQATENTVEDVNPIIPEVTFTATQVIQLLEKALTAGAGYTKAPTERSGGEALSQESLEKEEEKQPVKKKMKKMSKDMYKSSIGQVLDNIQKLYPSYSRDQLWGALKDRLTKKFPEISEV